MKRKRYIGSSFESFLEEEDILVDVNELAQEIIEKKFLAALRVKTKELIFDREEAHER